MKHLIRITVSLLMLSMSVFSEAAQFRRYIDITPSQASAPDGYQSVPAPYHLDRRLIESAVSEVANNFRSPQLRNLLSDRFTNRDQMLDDIQANLPFDATVRVLSIRAPRVLSQYRTRNESGERVLLSEVAVTVSSQLEFSDPESGFQRIEDTSEWLLSITSQELVLDRVSSNQSLTK